MTPYLIEQIKRIIRLYSGTFAMSFLLLSCIRADASYNAKSAATTASTATIALYLWTDEIIKSED